MSKATELADGLLSFAAMLPAYGFDPTHLIKSEAELRHLDRMKAELVEALKDAVCALEVCGKDYDYTLGQARSALTLATKETTK